MSSISISEGQIKEVLKQAIVEVLQEREEWFYDLFAEVIEDFALVNAIGEGEGSGRVSKEEVFNVLAGEA